jgi:prepilin-type N-terminal cleavage/methylation domain-containing protein
LGVSEVLVRFRSSRGFTLIDMLATVGLFAILAAIAIPRLHRAFEGYRLGIAVRNVERELQAARLKAVKANQPMRVRFNCPGTGQYRTVELIGTPSTPAAADADSQAATRCAYPYPASDTSVITRPNYDSPVQRLDPAVTFQLSQTIEFWPDGSAHTTSATNPWPVIDSNGVSIRLAKGTATKTVAVNGLGRIQVQ